MVKTGTLLGGEINSTEQQMEEIFQFEKKLAEMYEPKERLRNMEKIYHKMTVADLQQLAPAVRFLIGNDHKFILYCNCNLLLLRSYYPSLELNYFRSHGWIT